MKKTGLIIFLVAMTVMIAPSIPWAADGPTSTTAKVVSTAYHKIGIMPFMAGKFHANVDDIVEKTISCTIGQLCFEPQDIKFGGAASLNQYVREFLELRLDPGILIPTDQATDVYDAISTDENKDTMRSLAVRFGKSVNADYVLVGTVWRYRDRSQQGDDFERPASVAFVAYLIKVADGERVWKGYYDKSQGALTDDISNAPLFFKGGAKWLTANEIAKIAVKETFGNFPFDTIKGVAKNTKSLAN